MFEMRYSKVVIKYRIILRYLFLATVDSLESNFWIRRECLSVKSSSLPMMTERFSSECVVRDVKSVPKLQSIPLSSTAIHHIQYIYLFLISIIMILSSSRLVIRQASRGSARRNVAAVTPRRFLSSSTSAAASAHPSARFGAFGAGAMTLAAVGLYSMDDSANKTTWNAARLPTSGDVLSAGTPTKEKQTGILFPPLCNGMTLAGVGVRVKYVFVKVYAVGTYIDPIAMMAIKKDSKEAIEKALLDPTYPRTLRIVMNRGLSIDKYTAAIVESIEPRLKGNDLET